MKPLRVGSRTSALALRQTEIVLNALRRARPASTFEIVPISTEGDERRSASLRAIGGIGVFVKRIEMALLADEIDLAVHSLKDVPTALEPGLTLAAIPKRADPRDALIVRRGERASPIAAARMVPDDVLEALPPDARVGTGSARRAIQLRAIRADLRIEDVRGNVDTRLGKLDAGEFEALVLAVAGLTRLERLDRATLLLDPSVMLPMIGQGALAIEARLDDAEARSVASAIDDPDTRLCVETERAFLAALGGGCTMPVGALAEIEDDPASTLRLRVMLAGQGRIVRADERGPRHEAAAMVARLATHALNAVR